MAGTVRVEKCANENEAIIRESALKQLGFDAKRCKGSVHSVVARSTSNGSSTDDEEFKVIDFTWIVIAIRDR